MIISKLRFQRWVFLCVRSIHLCSSIVLKSVTSIKYIKKTYCSYFNYFHIFNPSLHFQIPKTWNWTSLIWVKRIMCFGSKLPSPDLLCLVSGVGWEPPYQTPSPRQCSAETLLQEEPEKEPGLEPKRSELYVSSSMDRLCDLGQMTHISGPPVPVL